ncbi:MAG: hypothetical protein A2Y94_01710 [Caldithrix sp. RBG_13_44_9]|nr:MAG: hypothetical protein A2Y94_01710 [Caldithrix sp. RBG_13_44_9]
MIKILISGCLLGEKVWYDGEKITLNSSIINQWQQEGRLISFCPEVAGGLPVPRLPSEIQSGDGRDVLTGKARIVDSNRVEVTDYFIRGARSVVRILETNLIKMAVLKSLSPACSKIYIYDGSFSNKIKPGAGILASFLNDYHLKLFDENELESACQYLQKLESDR